ncbi:hypothetical protein AB0D04_16205 [Streptomyces sp. NPDC048483]|uniref:terpene synthase family protein n=1 Tax=Streptomyces sp. NPDC048483 TaxID=3154927 RepID=UPI003436B7F7
MTLSDITEEIDAGLLTFYCPLPAQESPEAVLLQQRTLEWAEKFDLGCGDPERTAMLASVGAAYTIHVTPHAAGPTAQALCDYNAWAWAANERVSASRQASEFIVDAGRWERIMRSPHSWPDATDPMDAGLRDAFTRLRNFLTPVQWERFVAGQSHWISSMGWEAAVWEQGGSRTLNHYLAVRLGSAGSYSAAAFLDAVERIELGEREWAHPTLRAAVEAGMLAAILDNDRYSYPRERRLRIGKHNVFDVLRREHPEYSLGQAVTEGITLRDRLLTLYLQLRDQLLTDAGNDLRRYLTGLDCIISGNLTMAATAVRYLSPDTAHAFQRTSTPPCDLPTGPPPSSPTIAWWWDQLDT